MLWFCIIFDTQNPILLPHAKHFHSFPTSLIGFCRNAVWYKGPLIVPKGFIDETLKLCGGMEVVAQVRIFINNGRSFAFSTVAPPVYVVCKC